MENGFSGFRELKDICNIEISKELCPTEKQMEYVRQIGTTAQHRVGDVEVECVYGDMKLDKMLKDLICN